MPIVLNGATSGSTTIQPTDAVTVTCTLPSTGGTLQTSGSGYTTNGVAYATSTSALSTGSNLVFDGSNLGVGVTPSAWGSAVRSISVGNYTNSIVGNNSSSPPYVALFNNTYYNGSAFVYSSTNYASRFDLDSNSGAFKWYTAPSGTSGTNVTFTQAMTLDASGNLYVGATSVTAGYTGSRLVIGGTGSPGLKLQSTIGPNAWDIYTASGASLYFAYNASDKATINPSTGAYTALSDSKLKKDITDISYGLSDILKLRPVEYLMTEDSDGSQKHLGFIAQEAQTVLPSSVSEFANGYLGMDKTEIVAVLVKAIQEQQTLITSLTNRITALENK